MQVASKVKICVSQYLCLSYDLNDQFMVNLDPLATMMVVAWSNYHELHHMDEIPLKTLLIIESERGLG